MGLPHFHGALPVGGSHGLVAPPVPSPPSALSDEETPDFDAARQCIGEQFAWMESVLVLATLAQRWRFELDPTQRIVLRPLITLRSTYGRHMRLVRRPNAEGSKVPEFQSSEP